MDHPANLTDLQLAILRVLWKRSEATVQEIHADLEPARGLALSTVATVVGRLERKGVLERRSAGRSYLYSSLLEQVDVRRAMVSDLTRSLFRGDKKELMAHLVDPQELSSEELGYLKQLLDRAELDQAGGPRP